MKSYDEMKTMLTSAADAYYNNSESVLSDEEYDSLKAEFAARFPSDPLLKKIGAPVTTTKWKKFTHNLPMRSCNKVTNIEEFKKWINDNHLAHNSLTCSEKLDGISLALYFSNGNLIEAATRGDGTVGEDITANVLKMGNVKKKLPIPFTGALRGEIILTTPAFESINRELQARGEKPLSNMRNGCSGIAKKFNSPFAKYLSLRYYYAIGEGCSHESRVAMFEFIRKDLGLTTAPIVVGGVKKMIDVYNEYETSRRVTLDYDIDGLVIDVDDLKLQENLGLLGENLRGQVAWKFGAIKKETKIVDIEWSIGNSRRITPVSIVEPVQLVGATVTRATLHNVEMFNNLDLHQHDIVLMARAGDVIPYIYENKSINNKNRGKKFEIPSVCPVCGGKTTIDGKFLVCNNEDCSGSIQGDVRKWLKELDLLGIADKTVEKLYDAGFTTPSSLYTLTVNDALKLEHFGESSARKLVETLNAKTVLTLPEFIGGLNIPNVGTTTIENLETAGVDTLDKLMVVDVESLIKVSGIGEKTARAIIEGLKSKHTEIVKLLKVGITLKVKEKVMATKGGKLTGKSFCFTGKIEKIDANGERYTREKMWDVVRENGGEVAESVKRGVTYLVQADPTSTSNKTQAAQKFGVNIISEAEFFKMVR